jgi:hypothetical protein
MPDENASKTQETVLDLQVRIVYRGPPVVQSNQVNLSLSNGSQTLLQIWEGVTNFIAPNGMEELAKVQPRAVDFKVVYTAQQPKPVAAPSVSAQSKPASVSENQTTQTKDFADQSRVTNQVTQQSKTSVMESAVTSTQASKPGHN